MIPPKQRRQSLAVVPFGILKLLDGTQLRLPLPLCDGFIGS